MKRRAPVLLLAALSALAPASTRAGDEDKKKKEKPAAPAKAPYRAGDEVKDLSLELVAGGKWTAEGARKKVSVLLFASVAGFSKESLESLKKLAGLPKRYEGKGVEVLGVLRDSTVEKAREAAKSEKIAAPLAVDPKREAYDRFAERGLPYTVVLDAAGKVAYTAAGYDEDAVTAKLDALLKPKEEKQ